jgi:hypothetical protein
MNNINDPFKSAPRSVNKSQNWFNLHFIVIPRSIVAWRGRPRRRWCTRCKHDPALPAAGSDGRRPGRDPMDPAGAMMLGCAGTVAHGSHRRQAAWGAAEGIRGLPDSVTGAPTARASGGSGGTRDSGAARQLAGDIGATLGPAVPSPGRATEEVAGRLAVHAAQARNPDGGAPPACSRQGLDRPPVGGGWRHSAISSIAGRAILASAFMPASPAWRCGSQRPEPRHGSPPRPTGALRPVGGPSRAPGVAYIAATFCAAGASSRM